MFTLKAITLVTMMLLATSYGIPVNNGSKPISMNDCKFKKNVFLFRFQILFFYHEVYMVKSCLRIWPKRLKTSAQTYELWNVLNLLLLNGFEISKAENYRKPIKTFYHVFFSFNLLQWCARQNVLCFHSTTKCAINMVSLIPTCANSCMLDRARKGNPASHCKTVDHKMQTWLWWWRFGKLPQNVHVYFTCK